MTFGIFKDFFNLLLDKIFQKITKNKCIIFSTIVFLMIFFSMIILILKYETNENIDISLVIISFIILGIYGLLIGLVILFLLFLIFALCLQCFCMEYCATPTPSHSQENSIVYI